MAARRMSLTTMTSLRSQRSTNVPAIGLSSRFGSVAAKNTRPVARADPVEIATTATRASWLSRSPNSEISWPAHNAENEPLSASRTYGCCRTRSTVSGEGRGTGIAVAPGTAVAPATAASASNIESDGDERPVPGAAHDERTLESDRAGQCG